MSAWVEHELRKTLYSVWRATCESGLQETCRELVRAQQVRWQGTGLCLDAVQLLLHRLRCLLLVELGDGRFRRGDIDWRCIVLFGTALASDGHLLVVGVGQGNIVVTLLGLACRLRWGGCYNFRVDDCRHGSC